MSTTWQRIRDLARGLPAVSPLALALALRRPTRVPLLLADSLRAYRHYAGKRLPAITPWELLDYKGVATLRLGENGLFAAMEPNFLIMQLTVMLQPKAIFEIGTSQGRMTALMAMNLPETSVIHTLDLPPDASVPEHASDLHLIELAKRELGITFRGTHWEGRIKQLLGNSATFDFSPYYDAIDLVSIDGSHSLPFVLSDTLQAFRMIRPGGVLLWHDYESMRSEYGVSRVVDGLRKRHGLQTFRLSRDQGDTRFGVMRVDEAAKRRGIEACSSADNF